MTPRLAEILDDESPCDVDIRDDYAGRGMMGDGTHAAVFDSQDSADTALLSIAFELGSSDLEDAADLLKQMQRLRKDSMGHGIVLY